MARKKKGNSKADPSPPSIREHTDDMLPEDLSSQPLSSPHSAPEASDVANDDTSTAQHRIERDNKGKGRAEPSSSQVPESTSHDLPLHRLNNQDNSLNDQQRTLQQLTASSLIQYAPQNSSRDGPSGGLFEGSSNVEISGGKFNQTYGHHTSVAIHVHQPHEEYDTSQQHPLPPPAASPSQILNHTIATQSTQDIHRGQVPSMAPSESGPSMSTVIYSPDNSNKIYERHLELKKRGFPLWIPEPNRSLPMCYRRKGVNIGDVGIITSSGAFSFLFNICVPHDDPINPPMLPDGFAPIYPPIGPLAIREYSEFKPESYVASAAIEKIHSDPPFRGLSFQTSSAEGAILTFPDGAIARDLQNKARFKAYVSANIENWYRYVNGSLGCEAENGEIRIVIGCDKATSWGMAAVANLTQHKTHYLKYRSVEDSGRTTAPIPMYKWEYTGLAEARVGPDLQEIEDLKRNDDSDVATDGGYSNQCLFIRTLNPKLDPGIFTAISEELEAALKQDSQQLYHEDGRSNVASNPQTDSNRQQLGTNPSTHTGPGSESLVSATDNLNIGTTIAKERVPMSSSPSAPKSHPADVLNRILLEKAPNNRVVITEDRDWYSVIKEDDNIMPDPSELAERVLAAHHIREVDGVVFLEATRDHQSAVLHRRIPLSLSAQVDMEPQKRLADSSRPIGATSSASPPSPLGYNRVNVLAWVQKITQPMDEEPNHLDYENVERESTYYDDSSSSFSSPHCSLFEESPDVPSSSATTTSTSSATTTSTSSATTTSTSSIPILSGLIGADAPIFSSTSIIGPGLGVGPIGHAAHRSGLPVFSDTPSHPRQAFGSGYPSRNGQGVGVSRGSHTVISQYMPTHAPMISYPSSSYLPPILHSELQSMEQQFINDHDDNVNSLSSLATLPLDPPTPSDEETETWLRKALNIPAHKEVNLRSLSFGPKGPKISHLIALAIWGSQNHKLTLRQIYDAIEERYPSWKDQPDKPWQRSIRHNLSLKAMFVRSERPSTDPDRGYYWTLNVALGEGNKRNRKRKNRSEDEGIKEEEKDTDSVSSEDQGYPDTHPSTFRRGIHHYHYTNLAMHMSSHPSQGMMNGQQYIPQPPHNHYGMGHPQNLPMQSGHPGSPFPQTSPAWGTSPVSNDTAGGMFAIPPYTVQGHGASAHGFPYPPQGVVGTSVRHNPTGGMPTRSQQQAGRLQMPMQGGTMQMEEIFPTSTRSSRRSHSDTSPDDDDDEIARGMPRLRSSRL